jgi:glycosyltransferase involved in cell wall biosynthesis
VNISLVITTYNWKAALELTLLSLARQTQMPAEVLIADDGSLPDTGEMVHEWAQRLPVPLRHIWQPDEGFRVSRSRNRAIAASRGEYVLIVDGDMTLHQEFVSDHARAARRGYFIQGVRLLTKPATAQRMLREKTMDLGFFSRGIRRRRHTVRNRALSWLVYQQVHTHQKALRSSNQGYWREDLLRVNGFDERMVGWGREDNEIAARLYNVGIRRRNLKFAALAIHLYHTVRHPVGVNPNDVILHATIAEKRTRCALGIDQHLAEFSALGAR